jgi:glycosyltransferase involved in cell wall biosynthesis
MSISLAVIILTWNEERHLERAIRSVEPLASELVVVDSHSSDRTVDIARSLGARVYQHRFINHANQLQWALDNVSLTSAWVMRLDADEYVTSKLRDEIIKKLPGLDVDVTGVILSRRHIFLGRFIRHGGRYPLPLLRIWRKGAARVEQRWMDEHMALLTGHAVNFQHDFCDHNLASITSFIEKHNGYATREAIEALNQKYSFLPRDTILTESKQLSASSKRMLKERFYNRLPFAVGPLAYFFYRYFIRLGVLDGREGFAYHFLQGFWYRMLVSIKVMEFERAVSGLNSSQQMIQVLSSISGLDLGHDRQAQPEPSATRELDEDPRLGTVDTKSVSDTTRRGLAVHRDGGAQELS